jgi:starch-binding outer membrane protein, SusD/RagB family
MYQMKNKNIVLAAVAALGMMAGCSDEFLNSPPKDTLVDANFYKTDEQVLAGTAPLYSAVWKSYIDQANFKLGDIRGGSVFRAWNDRDAVEFKITGVSSANEQAYRAFWVVVGQANLAMHNIKTYGGAELSEEVKNYAIAEARFMRATAYTHLVMNYGAVPIIENNLDHLSSPLLRKNDVESVWEFIKRDYEFAAANLTDQPILEGRVSKWSAEGMLARTHLTLAGLNATPGARHQEHLDKAKEYAERVIAMSGKSLLNDYADLFRYPYDNNNESLFELQWVFSLDPDVGYDAANTMVSQITYSNDIAANNDGWGGDLGASWWMLSLYDGLITEGDPDDLDDDGAAPGFTLDQRLKASFMLPGFTYPEITQTVRDSEGNASDQDLVFPDPGAATENSFASIKKYVVGKAVDVGGQADRQRYPNNTYMLRLAEMYLIYAEAVLGNNSSTSDGTAIGYFNAVHERAGLPPVTSIDWEDIFNERVKEFAMESMTWYDLVRLHYYDPQEAYRIINAQDRGTFVVHPNQWPNPTGWTFVKNSWVAIRKAEANEGNFYLPFPTSELAQAPTLNEDPVPYEFND